MKEHILITISRNYGSGGREIGEKLAKRLGIKFYDKELISMLADKTGMDETVVKSADEHILPEYVSPYFGATDYSDNINVHLQDAQAKLLRELAQTQSCVIVGRLGDYVLRKEADCLKVFIYAPVETRIRTVMVRENLNEDQARKLVKKMDKMRRSYYSYFTDQIWEGTEGRDIMIDSSRFGIDGTVELLVSIAENMPHTSL